ncbi:hypothetical protein [Thermodesulfovibrio yellowstonii]|uniref:hypothetical protein n=1 Tax=Thermodesulfovibrio yellowstonii TaxID=28262 RepID=UPI000418D1B7|nr:hypothetical protein [Thermodesulfovibrio islandicus]
MLKNVREVLEKERAYQTTDTTNHEGHPSWQRKGLDRVEEILFLGTTGNTFYVDAESNIKRFISDLKKEIFSNKDKAPVIADMIASARQEGLFRTIPIVALILLRAISTQEFERVFPKVILTGQDMADFITLNNSFGYGFGRSVKRAISKWLEGVPEFYAVKYRKNFADAVAMARPKVDSMENSLLLKYIYGVKKDIPEEVLSQIFEKHPQVKSAELFKKATSVVEKLRIAEEYRLPADLIISELGASTDEIVWQTIARQMGTMQLLKYLNKVLSCAPSLADYIKERLTIENIKKAKIFPYRLFVAWENIQNKEIAVHLEKLLSQYILEHSPFQDWMRELRFAVCPDISGSMTATDRGVTPSHVAGFFSMMAVPLGAHLVAWDTGIRWFKTPEEVKSMNPFDIYREIAHAKGGGTYMELAVRPFREKRIPVDCFIILTDNEEWGSGFIREFDAYKRTVNRNAKAIIVEIVGYGHSPYDPKRDDIVTIYGWSDIVFKFIERKMRLLFCK